MDYIGSKAKINEWIFENIESIIPSKEWKNLWFLDGCAGSGSTSKYAIKKGFKVISNDLFVFSSCIVKGFSGISLKKFFIAEKYNDDINKLEGIKGFFYKNYSESAGRLYFTDENSKLIDSTRKYIETIKDTSIKNYLLYISLEAISKVLNTTGVQAAFLKNIKKRASNRFIIKSYPYFYSENVNTYNNDIVELLNNKKIKENILYIDPPYTLRQYGPNYHLYETFVRDDSPILAGKTGLRDWKSESKSDFCSKKNCLLTFEKIVSISLAKLILISYSSDGLLSENELVSLFKKFRKVKILKRKQNRYKADNNRKNDNSVLEEYLFILH